MPSLLAGLDACAAALLGVRPRRELHPDASQPHDGHEEGMEVARAGAGEAAELDGLLRPMRDGGALMPSACVVQVKALVLLTD